MIGKQRIFVFIAAISIIFCCMSSSLSQEGKAKGFTSPSLGAEFVLLPAGSFMMGSPGGEEGRFSDEEPRHRVTISRSFYMQTTEVTQGQWKRIMGDNPSYFNQCGNDCPVENIYWRDTQEFIGRLNAREETEKYRLPTEAEWEYAARAGTTTRFHTGDRDDDMKNAGWYNANSGLRTHPVARKTPNAWGLYDMHGNVWEWVQDWKGDYDEADATDPAGPPSGLYRVNRGGSWNNDAKSCRAANRNGFTPNFRNYRLGFRLVMMP